MLYDFLFTEKAEQDLDEILTYISNELCNKKATKDFFDKVFSAIDTLRACPKTGMVLDNEYVLDKSIRRVLIDNYVMYYKFDEANEKIIILRILYAKRNLTEILNTI